MEYEQLHTCVYSRSVMRVLSVHACSPWSRDACGFPTLSRFEGKDGIYSPKARLLNLFGYAPCCSVPT